MVLQNVSGRSDLVQYIYLSTFGSLDFLDLYQMQAVIATKATPANSNRTTTTTRMMVVVLLEGVTVLLGVLEPARVQEHIVDNPCAVLYFTMRADT